MKTYKVTITEINRCVVEVEAENADEARNQVEADFWKNSDDYLLEPYETVIE